jgi:hypothetical protein
MDSSAIQLISNPCDSVWLKALAGTPGYMTYSQLVPLGTISELQATDLGTLSSKMSKYLQWGHRYTKGLCRYGHLAAQANLYGDERFSACTIPVQLI